LLNDKLSATKQKLIDCEEERDLLNDKLIATRQELIDCEEERMGQLADTGIYIDKQTSELRK
jgi:hypothetical protein